MDWIKAPVDRLFGFLAALVPGGTTLLLISLHNRAPLHDFWSIATLGYQTKFAVVLLACFSAGWTAISAYQRFSGALGGAIGGIMKPPELLLKPWENANWRALLRAYLGDAAPMDITPISNETYQLLLDHAGRFQDPEGQRQQVRLQKLQSEANSGQWRVWWDNLLFPALFDYGPVGSMSATLTANFQTASLILLGAMPFTPSLRRWWIVAPCLFWLLAIVSEVYYVFRQVYNPWLCFQKQIEFLRRRVAKPDNVEQ